MNLCFGTGNSGKRMDDASRKNIFRFYIPRNENRTGIQNLNSSFLEFTDFFNTVIF
jgi:hypothetical protein